MTVPRPWGGFMAGMHATTEIRRRIEDVYAGTTFRMRQRSLGKVRDQMVHVLAVEPNRRIDFEAEFGPVRPRFTLSFEPTATGTRVTLRGDSRPIGPLKLVPSFAGMAA